MCRYDDHISQEKLSLTNLVSAPNPLFLHDTFRVKEPESPLSWDEVSLYRNEFDEPAFYHGRLASKCKLFTSEEFGLAKVSALPISNRRNPAALLKFAEQYGSEDLMRRMFVLDAVVLNIDRHLANL